MPATSIRDLVIKMMILSSAHTEEVSGYWMILRRCGAGASYNSKSRRKKTSLLLPLSLNQERIIYLNRKQPPGYGGACIPIPRCRGRSRRAESADGAIINYYLDADVSSVRLEILDSKGKIIQPSIHPVIHYILFPKTMCRPTGSGRSNGFPQTGSHRFAWDMPNRSTCRNVSPSRPFI